MLRIPMATVAIALSSACTTVEVYTPLNTPRARIVLQNHEIAVFRNGRVVPRPVVPNDLRCAEAAVVIARQSNLSADAAKTHRELAMVFAYLAPVLTPVFQALAESRQGESDAALVDAVNLHNEVPACAELAAEVSP